MKFSGTNQGLRIFVIGIILFSLFGNTYVNADSSSSEKSTVGWSKIAVGIIHSLAIKEDGTVWAWGDNSWGQIGNGDRGGNVSSLKVLSPVQVKGIRDVIAIAAGGSHSLAVKKDGTVWAWGGNLNGVLGNGKETFMESTKKHPEGEVIGNNDQTLPVQVFGISDVVAVAANHSVSYALKKDGTIWGWGFVSRPNSTSPIQLEGWFDVISITTKYNLLALKSDGTVWTYDSKGVPSKIEGLINIKAIADSGGTSYAIDNDGTVWVWGINFGDGKIIDRSIPVQVKGIKDVVAIQAHSGGPFYLKKDGTVWTSGDNVGGQLGIGSYEDSDIPVQVHGLMRIKQIAGGLGYRALAIKTDGTLWAWGNGYVGDGTQRWRTTPVWIKSYESEELAEDQILVEIDDKTLDFDQPPLIINDRTMVPLRKIFETLGTKIDWDDSTSTVTATKGQTVIKLAVGGNIAYIIGLPVNLDTPATIVNGRTLVPVRFIVESLGAKVAWEDASKTVKIATK